MQSPSLVAAVSGRSRVSRVAFRGVSGREDQGTKRSVPGLHSFTSGKARQPHMPQREAEDPEPLRQRQCTGPDTGPRQITLVLWLSPRRPPLTVCLGLLSAPHCADCGAPVPKFWCCCLRGQEVMAVNRAAVCPVAVVRRLPAVSVRCKRCGPTFSAACPSSGPLRVTVSWHPLGSPSASHRGMSARIIGRWVPRPLAVTLVAISFLIRCILFDGACTVPHLGCTACYSGTTRANQQPSFSAAALARASLPSLPQFHW